MNRKQRKAKRLRATQHTKSRNAQHVKLGQPVAETLKPNRAEAIQFLLDENKKLSELAQKKQRNIGRGALIVCVVALIWLVVLWIK